MYKTSYSANSSTSTQARQLNQGEKHFSAMLDRMQAGGPAPDENEIERAGDLANILSELKDSLEVDGIPGLGKTLQIMSSAKGETGRKLNRLLSFIETEKEQDQEPLPDGLEIGKQGRPIYITYTEDDIESFPDIEYLVNGILQTATVSMLFGESNTGKTFVGLHLAQCVARDNEWLGRRVSAGRVLYIYAEGKLGLKRRVQAWRKHYNQPTTSEVRYILQPVHLIDNKEFLCDTLEDQDQVPALVIIDTFSNCTIGTNQNDQMEVAKVLATAHDITRRWGSHVMVIHHTNKAGGVNGSAAFRNHVDTMIELSREGKDGPLTMRCEKQRDAGYFSDIRLALQVVDLGLDLNTCEAVTSCVVTLHNAPEKESSMSETRRQMLELLELNGRLTYGGWKKACEDAGLCKKSAFSEHVKYFVAEKKVSKSETGAGRSTWYTAIPATSPTSPQLVQPDQMD